jgi:hypothetical protein
MVVTEVKDRKILGRKIVPVDYRSRWIVLKVTVSCWMLMHWHDSAPHPEFIFLPPIFLS